MKDFKFLDTRKLMIYSEVCSGMVNRIDELGMRFTKCMQEGRITEDEMQEVHEKLKKNVEILEDRRIKLVKEVNKRFRKDVGVTTGPSDLDVMFNKIAKEYPDVFKEDAQWNYEQSQKKKAKEEGSKMKVVSEATGEGGEA